MLHVDLKGRRMILHEYEESVLYGTVPTVQQRSKGCSFRNMQYCSKGGKQKIENDRLRAERLAQWSFVDIISLRRKAACGEHEAGGMWECPGEILGEACVDLMAIGAVGGVKEGVEGCKPSFLVRAPEPAWKRTVERVLPQWYCTAYRLSKREIELYREEVLLYLPPRGAGRYPREVSGVRFECPIQRVNRIGAERGGRGMWTGGRGDSLSWIRHGQDSSSQRNASFFVISHRVARAPLPHGGGLEASDGREGAARGAAPRAQQRGAARPRHRRNATGRRLRRPHSRVADVCCLQTACGLAPGSPPPDSIPQ